MKSTFLREYHNEVDFKLSMPESSVYVDLPEEFEEQLTTLANEIKDPSDEVGARRLKQVMTFVMACALKQGRDVVTLEDMDKLEEYSTYFNPDCESEL